MREARGNDARARGFFAAIATNCPAWSAKFAFAAGIVTHTVSDRIVHGVIDHVIEGLGLRGRPAMAIHRQIETLIDMVLFAQRGCHPGDFDLAKVTRVHDPTRDILFQFYLSQLSPPSNPIDRSLVEALKRAQWQQVSFLKSFSSRTLYRGISISNKVAAGRLQAWSTLFYPRSVGPKVFPILKSLDLERLTDGHVFCGPPVSLVNAIAADAIGVLYAGAQGLRWE
jgi:hypothetical protein